MQSETVVEIISNEKEEIVRLLIIWNLFFFFFFLCVSLAVKAFPKANTARLLNNFFGNIINKKNICFLRKMKQRINSDESQKLLQKL